MNLTCCDIKDLGQCVMNVWLRTFGAGVHRVLEQAEPTVGVLADHLEGASALAADRHEAAFSRLQYNDGLCDAQPDDAARQAGVLPRRLKPAKIGPLPAGTPTSSICAPRPSSGNRVADTNGLAYPTLNYDLARLPEALWEHQRLWAHPSAATPHPRAHRLHQANPHSGNGSYLRHSCRR
jgi:hypothetical protein